MNQTAVKLHSKIRSKKATVAVVGMGYVGLPVVMAFIKKGFKGIGVDLDLGRITKLRQGRSYVEDVPSSEVARAIRSKCFWPTESYEDLGEADIIIICVPTPLNRVKDPDLSFILRAAEEIRNCLRPGQLIILESTTYPGTTEEVVLPALERSGLKVGKDFFLCFSPERIDPGNKQFPFTKIPKVVGGVTAECTRLAASIYGQIIKQIIPVTSARTDEMTKLLENILRIVNIGLVNELAQVAHALEINIWAAIEAASTKPCGDMPFFPGPGIGGHCIGIDPIYLSWKARLVGHEIDFIELARRINARMPRFVTEQAGHLLNERSRKAVKGSRILVLGVSYKKDVGDVRESPALEVLEHLKELGAKISYHDPYVPELKNEHYQLRSEPLTPANLKKKDLVIVTTGHSKVNYAQVARHAPLVFDTRNVKTSAFNSKNVVRL